MAAAPTTFQHVAHYNMTSYFFLFLKYVPNLCISAYHCYKYVSMDTILSQDNRYADIFQNHSSTSSGSNLSPYSVTNATAVNTEHIWKLTEIGMENATKAQLSIGHTRSSRIFTDYPKREHRGIIVKMENIRKHKNWLLGSIQQPCFPNDLIASPIHFMLLMLYFDTKI